MNSMRSSSSKVFIHVFLWLLLFIYPILSLNREYLIFRNWLSLSSILIVFYINYFVLVDVFFFKSRKRLFYLSNVLIVLFQYVFFSYTLQFEVFHPSLDGSPVREIRTGAFTTIQLMLPLVLSIGMCVGLKINSKLTKNQLALQEAKELQLHTEIKYLKYQVQPHFLFNTLNNIYALIDQSPTIAKESIHSMSKMMRYVLHDSSVHKIPLAREIEFLERYISLMQLRISPNVHLEKSFPIVNQPIQIAPFLLITFVENAFKHGIDAVLPSYIHIKLEIENSFIQYSVSNSSFPEREKATDSGIGLGNLKKRLELLYPANYTLETNKSDHAYTASLTLNFKE